MDHQRIAEAWTAQRVEGRLIAAFRAAPGRPILATGTHMERGLDGRSSPMTDAMTWTRRFVDRADGLVLLTWARCRAEKSSFSEQCRERDWNRSTVEEARRRATDRIVAGLNSEQNELDSRKSGEGACASDAQDIVLANA